MGLDIAIYNGNCTDGKKIINSIKSACLYADNVRLYDNVFPLNLSDDGISLQAKLEIDVQELIKLDPFDVIPNYRLIVLPENINHSTEGMKVTISKKSFYLCKFIKELREVDFSDYSWEQCVKKFEKMGVHYIIPIFQTQLGKDAHVDLLDYVKLMNQFLDDKGFKILNDIDDLSPQSSHPTSMWSPAYLSEYVISTLPGFENATLDEIADIRGELDKYVIPYRAAILRMAQTIKEIPSTDSFQRECMTLYLREIEPQVAAINAAVLDNNVYMNIAKKVITNKETWASIGALVTAFATQGDIANAVGIGTAAAFGGLSIAQGIMSTLEEKKKIKENEMFFLYEAGQRLKK